MLGVRGKRCNKDRVSVRKAGPMGVQHAMVAEEELAC